MPTGIDFDERGNLYIYDNRNYNIRKVDTAGIITTIVGVGVPGFSPDHSRADTIKLSGGGNIKAGKYGELYFFDNNRIRCVDTQGYITTIAGNGVFGYAGDGGPAINAQIGGGFIALDTFKNLFIANLDGNRIRKVTSDGYINTVAGTGVAGYSGDWGPPLLATLCSPTGIAIDKHNNIYECEQSNRVVRKITSDTTLNVFISGPPEESNLYITPNPSDGNISVCLSGFYSELYTATIYTISGIQVFDFSGKTNDHIELNTHLVKGVYIIKISTKTSVFSKKIIIK